MYPAQNGWARRNVCFMNFTGVSALVPQILPSGFFKKKSLISYPLYTFKPLSLVLLFFEPISKEYLSKSQKGMVGGRVFGWAVEDADRPSRFTLWGEFKRFSRSMTLLDKLVRRKCGTDNT